MPMWASTSLTILAPHSEQQLLHLKERDLFIITLFLDTTWADFPSGLD